MSWWGSTNTIYIKRLESVIQLNLWVLFWKLIKKLWNNGRTKNLRHRAWLDCSVFQLLKIQVKAKKPPWLKVIWVSLKVRSVYSNLEENFCLNACVLLKSCYNIFKKFRTPDLLLGLALLRDEQRLSLGEFVDGS